MLILLGQVPNFESLTCSPSSTLTSHVTWTLLWVTCPSSGAGLRTIVIYLLASAIYFIGLSSLSSICFVYNIDGDFQFLGTSEDEPMPPFISKYIIDLSSRKYGVPMVFSWGWEICSILRSGYSWAKGPLYSQGLVGSSLNLQGWGPVLFWLVAC